MSIPAATHLSKFNLLVEAFRLGALALLFLFGFASREVGLLNFMTSVKAYKL